MAKGFPERRAVSSKPPVLVLPMFEDNRQLLLACTELLNRGETAPAYARLNEMWQRCQRIPSERYQHLSDYLRHALLALESGEFEGGRCVLLTAAVAFGWSSAEEAGGLFD